MDRGKDGLVAEMFVAVGDAAGDGLAEHLPGSGSDVVLDLGAQHPSSHGLLRLRLVVDGDVIRSAEPLVGYLHRGAEKLFEVRDYRQILVLANRHDWLSAFANELGVALAVERMLALPVPERATWLRTLLAELNRILSHLMFLGGYRSGATGAGAALLAARERESVQAVLEEACGGRIHFMVNRIGGLTQDVPTGWTERARNAVDGARSRLPALAAAVTGAADFSRRTAGIGVLARPDIDRYGVSGPVARASGADFDLRRDEPYLAYTELGDALRVVTRSAGDCRARIECLLEQVEVSLDLAGRCLDRLPDIAGPVNVRLPTTVRAPEGHVYVWTESPLGINGYYLVSRGDKTPWRLKLRTASFNNVQALGVLLPGSRVEDLETILGSMFFIVGDIDK